MFIGCVMSFITGMIAGVFIIALCNASKNASEIGKNENSNF